MQEAKSGFGRAHPFERHLIVASEAADHQNKLPF
jgi:hypothetical protein